MVFFSACLAAGTAFLFGISNVLAAVQKAVAGKARELLAADIDIGAAHPLGPKVDAAIAALQKRGVRSTKVLYFASMLSPDGGRPFLVSVKAIEPGYPFYGTLETEPPNAAPELFKGSFCLLENAAALEHDLKPGSKVKLGDLELTLAGTVLKEPDRAVGNFSMGPRLVLSRSTVEQTGLLRFGSRVWHERLLALPPSRDPAKAAADIKTELDKTLDDPYLDVTAYSESDPTVRESFQRSSMFFVLVALVALVLGAAGMGAGLTMFLNEQLETAGILRSLGLRQGEIAKVYHSLCVAIGVIGGLLGAAAGWLLSLWGVGLLQSLLKLSFPVEPSFDPGGLAASLALAAALSVGVPFTRVRALARLPPLDILRGTTDRLPATPWGTAATIALGLAGIFALAWLRINSVDIARYFTLSLAGAGLVIVALITAALAAVGGAATAVAAFPLRHGLLQLTRRRGRTLIFLFTLSVGFTLLGTLDIVHHSLAKELLLGKAADAPDLFLVDIQKSQLPGVQALVGRFAAGPSDFSPLIRARLAAINGVPIQKRDMNGRTLEERSRQRFLTREYNLTYKDALNSSEKVTAGRFWSPGDTGMQVSLEQSFAKRIGVHLGDTLTFDIAGRDIAAPVTSLRSIDWVSMKPNFFVAFPTAALEAAPQVFIASLRIRDDARIAAFEKELVKRFPNVSVINVARILDNVQKVLGALVGTLRAISWFCVAVGLLVLAGTLSLGRKERREQAALFRALGCERADLLRIDALEFAAIGALTFLIAWAVSYALAWAVSRKMDVELAASPLSVLTTLGLSVLLPVTVGLAINAKAYGAGVLETFRSEA